MIKNIEHNQLNLRLLIHTIDSKHENYMFHVNRITHVVKSEQNCFCFELFIKTIVDVALQFGRDYYF